MSHPSWWILVVGGHPGGGFDGDGELGHWTHLTGDVGVDDCDERGTTRP